MKSFNISNIALALVCSIITGGGGYIFFKVDQIQKQNNNSAVELEKKIEQFVSPKTATSSNFESTTTQTTIITDDLKKEDVKSFEKKYTSPPNIIVESKTVKNEEVSIAASTITPQNTPDNLKVEEKKKFDIYWVTLLSVVQEQNAAESQINAAINIIKQDSVIAYSYSQEALKLCDSSHKINSENTPPQLPFWSDMYELNKIYASSASLCKQRAIVVRQMSEYATNSESSQLSAAAKTAFELVEQELALSKKAQVQTQIVAKIKNAYFSN